MKPEANPEGRFASALVLPADEVHVWGVPLGDALAGSFVQEDWLSPEERRRAVSYRFARDRQRFVRRRCAARVILGRYLDQQPRRIQFCYLENGKPALAAELAGSGLTFNWSHSDGLALYAVARGRRVGVDLERHRSDVEHLSIAGRFFTPTEVATLRAGSDEEQQAAFFSHWACKEAAVKALGHSLSFPLDQIEVPSLKVGAAASLRVQGRMDEASVWSIRQLVPATGYAAAVVAEGSDWQLRCRDDLFTLAHTEGTRAS